MAKNRVTLEGFVRKIELWFSTSGTPVLSIHVPIDRRRKNRDTGEFETQNTTWWSLSTWEADAEYQAEHLREGDLIQFTGLPELEKREGKDGQTYTNAVMKYPTIAKVLRAPKDARNGGQGGFQGQGGGSTRPNNSRPSQGQPGVSDPWGQQGGQSYDWNSGNDQETPF